MTVQDAERESDELIARQHASAETRTEAPTLGAASFEPRRLRLTAARVALVAAIVGLLGAVGLWLGVLSLQGGRSASSSSAAVEIGGPFNLIDQNGRRVDQGVLLGKWSAVFFGYIDCPDTCPATLQTLAAASQRLSQPPGQAGDRFQVVFISVDPARDTPARMKLYLSNQVFPRQALGLTGSPAQTASVAKAYKVYYAKAGSGPDYAVQHSAVIYLMDPRGRFVRPLNDSQAPQALARDISDAMGRN